MIQIFLKAKHWQLFLLIFVLPLFIYFGWLISFLGDFIHEAMYESDELPVDFFSSFVTMLALMIIPIAIQYAWFWSMAIGLQKKLPADVKMNVPLFKAFFIIPLVYGLLYLLFLISFFSNIERLEDLEHMEDFSNIGWLIGGIFIFITLSLFVMVCTFYQYWFIAKTIKCADQQKDLRFGDFVGEFFLVWFYPIGVWILQPMINRILERDSQKE
jgi:hypothetical protein